MARSTVFRRALRRLPPTALALAVGIAVPAGAEENCDRMLDQVVHFRGTVRTLEPLGRQEVTAMSIGDIDPRFLVSILVDAVESSEAVETTGPVKKAATLSFAVHSPSRSLGPEAKVGLQLDLDLEELHCNGAFRRTIGLRRQSREPEPYEGAVEVGRTYRAVIRWVPTEGVLLEPRLRMPMHHIGGFEWVNAGAAPPLASEASRATIVFTVLSQQSTQVAAAQWFTTYQCKILTP